MTDLIIRHAPLAGDLIEKFFEAALCGVQSDYRAVRSVKSAAIEHP